VYDGRGVARWHVGLPPEGPRPGDGVVALTAAELERGGAAGAVAAGLHEVVRAWPRPAPEVEVHVPPYRGMSFVPVLSWLATRLGAPGATATWYADRQQGPDSIRRLLEGLGWLLERDRRGRTILLRGAVPPEAAPPAPRRYEAVLGPARVRLLADYGVFSPDHVDDGTALLLDVALAHPRVDRVADIGVGCGPLAIGLLLAGVAGAVTGTDVDCAALWLAAENARACGVALALRCTPDPAAAGPTPLTVCNVPTHIDRRETERFMAALAERARHGRLLAVVHASLEARYAGHLEAAGLGVGRHAGPAHVVLDAAAAGADRGRMRGMRPRRVR
jgi:16S rRNA (guanine1207-N2)-methyltransferase